MRISYEFARGLVLAFEPDENIAAIEHLKLAWENCPTEQGKVVAEYYIALLEEELCGGVQ